MQSKSTHKECKKELQDVMCPIMRNKNKIDRHIFFVCSLNCLQSMVHMEPKMLQHLPNCLPMLLLEPLWKQETFQRSFHNQPLQPCKWRPFQAKQKPGRMHQCFVLCEKEHLSDFLRFNSCILASQNSTNESTCARANLGKKYCRSPAKLVDQEGCNKT